MAVDTTQIMADLAQIHTDFHSLFDSVGVGSVSTQFDQDIAQVGQDVTTAVGVVNSPPPNGIG